MGMRTNIYGIEESGVSFDKLKSIVDAYKNAEMDVPSDIAEMYDECNDGKINNINYRTNILCSREQYVVLLDNIPVGVTGIVFENSW